MKKINSFLIAIAVVCVCLFVASKTYAAEPILWEEMEIATYRENKGGKENFTHPTKANYVFAGWYQEENGAALSEDIVSGKAYAKFVKEEVLSFKGQLGTDTEVGSKSTYLRMVTSIDSLRYNQVGFKVKILDKTSYRWSTIAYETLKGYADEKEESYTPSVFSEISEYFVAYRISNIPNSSFLTGITITPVWETLDGTTVEGVLRTITVHEGIGEEASIVTVENDEDRNHVYCTVEKPVKDGNTVTFDVNVEPSQEVQIYVLGEGSWNKEYFSETYTVSETQSIQASVPEDIDAFMLYAKFKDTTKDYSENIVEFQNIRIMGKMSSDTEETVKETSTSYGQVWSAPSTVKIAQDNLSYTPKGAASLNYEAVRNEYESKQLIITASKDVSSFELKPANLVSTSDKTKTIAADNIQVYVEKYIIDCDDSRTDDFDPYGEPQDMPDALIPMAAAANYQENTIAANKNGALWVTVYVPEEDTPAGTYSGTFELVMQGTDGVYKQDIPVSVKVYDYTLSDEETAKTLFSWRYSCVSPGELDGSIDMMTSYYEFFQDYRISLQDLPLESLMPDEFADMVVKYYDDCTTYSLMSTVGNISIGITDYQEEVIEQVLAIAKASGKEKRNLFEKAMIYTIDEPDLTTEAGRTSVINQSKALYSILSKCVSLIEADANTYQAFTAMFASEQEWKNAILDIPSIIPLANTKWLCGQYYNDDATVKQAVKAFLATMTADDMPSLTLCPLFTGYSESTSGGYKNSLTNLTSLQKEYGFDLWWYGCVGPEADWPTYHINDSNLLSSRTLSWLQLKYNVTGNLYWDAAAYTRSNQYVDIYETGDRASVAGDGFLAYPGAAYGVYGAIPSMRLMSIRDGMEEYEMLKEVEKTYASVLQDYFMYTNFYKKIVTSSTNSGNKTQISTMKSDSDGWFDNLRSDLLNKVAESASGGADGISDTPGYEISYEEEPTLLTKREYRNDIHTNLLFSFESYKDITGTAPSISGQLGTSKINKSQYCISEGKASWMIQPQGDYGKNDSYPYIKLQCKDNSLADSTFITSDFSGYDKLILDVYNASAESVRIKWTLTVLDSEGNTKETEPAYFTLQPNAWNTCEYFLTDSIYETYLMLDDVQYLTITFLTQKESKTDSVPTLYLDNLRGHEADTPRETSTYGPVFAEGIGFEHAIDAHRFVGYLSSNRLNLSRISYQDADITPKNDSFGEYALLGVATDGIWPRFAANLDKTYSAGSVLRFWMYVDVDEVVAEGKTFRVEAFGGHNVLTSSIGFNAWVAVDIQLSSDTDTLSAYLNFDRDNNGWYSKLGAASVHVYMDNFQITENPSYSFEEGVTFEKPDDFYAFTGGNTTRTTSSYVSAGIAPANEQSGDNLLKVINTTGDNWPRVDITLDKEYPAGSVFSVWIYAQSAEATATNTYWTESYTVDSTDYTCETGKAFNTWVQYKVTLTKATSLVRVRLNLQYSNLSNKAITVYMDDFKIVTPGEQLTPNGTYDTTEPSTGKNWGQLWP